MEVLVSIVMMATSPTQRTLPAKCVRVDTPVWMVYAPCAWLANIRRQLEPRARTAELVKQEPEVHASLVLAERNRTH